MADPSLAQSFETTLRSLTKWFEADRVPYTAIGGLAVSLLAQPRATQDIDVVVWLDERSWDSFVRAGEGYGFEGRVGDVVEFAIRSRVFLLRHSGSGISVDISCGALPFEHEMIERSQTFQIGDVLLRVPTPEDLIITKAVAHRAKDLQDIEALLRANKNLNTARIRQWVYEFAVALETPELSDDVERLLLQHQQS